MVLASIFAASACGGGASHDSGQPPLERESVCTDASGDQVASANGSGDGDYSDLVSASLSTDGETIRASVTFADDGPHDEVMATYFVLSDPAAGSPVAIGFGSTTDGQVRQGDLDNLAEAGARSGYPVIASGQSYSVDIPVEDLPVPVRDAEWVAATTWKLDPADADSEDPNFAIDLVTGAVDTCPEQDDESAASLSLGIWPGDSSLGATNNLRIVPSLESTPNTTTTQFQPATTASNDGAATGDANCSLAPTERIGGEQAAECLFAAWANDDRDLAVVYATPSAAETLLDVPFDDMWEFDGCEQPTAVAYCSFSYLGGGEGGTLEMRLGGGPSAGNFVDSVEFYG